MNGQTDVQMNGWMDGWMDRWTDGQTDTDRRMDGQTDGQMDKQMDGQMEGRMDIHPCVLQDIGPFGSLPKNVLGIGHCPLLGHCPSHHHIITYTNIGATGTTDRLSSWPLVCGQL